MTAPAPKSRGVWIHPALAAFLGGFFGATGASMILGLLIGIKQMEEYGWLAVPAGAFAGPMILYGDLMLIAEGGPLEHITALPWAVPGLFIGVVAGLWYARSSSRMPASN